MKLNVVSELQDYFESLYVHFSQSDENLLKNIELFDKLAVLYQGRLNFFKDIFGFSSNEICQWTFYNKLGQKRAEVCCSSIVYATEKKNIKVQRYILLVNLFSDLFSYWRYCLIALQTEFIAII